MVFEKVLATVLNKVLGDYVENIDSSQLNCGIFAGDVTLKDLKVQENALENMDMPYRIVSGYIGELTLKIPWKNLYTAPTIALVDSVHILITPTLDVTYNAKKEEEASLAAKKRELERIEEAKRIAEQKNKPKEVRQDTFVEKLTANIIKNLQVKISGIHIRYEDRITNPRRPFAVGFTLHNLSLDTTDSSWNVCVIQDDTVKVIHKLVVLDSLALYWNTSQSLFSTQTDKSIKDLMKAAIASADRKPVGVSYILGPINSQARLRLNLKPETDIPEFSIPAVALEVVVEEIALGISKFQYQGVMELLDSFDRMVVASTYRKYRPNVPCKGNPLTWWRFAITAITEEEVKRRKQNWSWTHMHNHRIACRDYRELYKEKLLNSKLPRDKQLKLDEYEKILDVFNITVVRKEAELAVTSELKRRAASQAKGWLSGWFWGGQTSKSDQGGGEDIMSQLAAAMNTPEEKAKLYEAIGYQDNAAPVEYPIEYVKNTIRMELKNLSLTISDESRKTPQVMKFELKGVTCAVQQRPSAQAIWLETSVDGMNVLGSPNETGKTPAIVYPQTDDSSSVLLHVLFETNPLDKSCDQRVDLKTQPVEIVYDATTINNLVDVLKPPESIALQQLQAMAMMKIQDMKEMSAYGLQYAIEQHKVLVAHLDFKPLFLIIPEKGVYNSEAHALILSLGNLQIHSVPRESNSLVSVSNLVKAGRSEDEVLSTMMSQAYDKFRITVQNVEALLACPGDNWKVKVGQDECYSHLIRPINVNILLQKCIIPDDVRMPKLIIGGDLPLLSLAVSDSNLYKLANLFSSLPLPEGDKAAPQTPAFTSKDGPASVQNAQTTAKAMKLATQSEPSAPPQQLQRSQSQAELQYTEVEVKFEIKEMGLDIFQVVEGAHKHMLRFAILRLGTHVVMRTFDMSAAVYMGGVSFESLEYKDLSGGPLYILNTPRTEHSEGNLFTLQYLSVNKNAPGFETTYYATLQTITVDVSELDIVLHQDAILSTINFAKTVMTSLEEKQPKKKDLPPIIEMKRTGEVPIGKRRTSGLPTDLLPLREAKPRRKHVKSAEQLIIDMKVLARMSSIGVTICNIEKAVSNILLKGLEASVVMDKKKTSVSALWKDVLVLDPTPNAVHPKIISCLSDDVLSVGLELFNESTQGEKYSDISAVDMKLSASLGRMRIVYLNMFISSLMDFLNQFQAAKDKIAEASTAAAKSAKESVEQAYASRISLSITLNAPIIIIPRNSTSLEALVADLGTLKVHNAFELGQQKNELGMPSVFDTLTLELVELKVLRGVLNKMTGSVEKKCVLLEPISFVMEITRNLSSSWCTDVPEMSVKGNLDTIHISFSQDDIGAVLQTLNENLGEGAATSPSPSVSTTDTIVAPEALSVETISPTQSDEEAKQVQDKISKKLVLVFQLESIVVAFYEGKTNLDVAVSKRSPKNAYVRTEVRTIAVKGEMLTDDTMWFNVILGNFILDDTRVWRKAGILRLFERKVTEQSGTGGMIDVTFVQSKNGDKFLNTNISSFMLVMSLEYLKNLGDYFTKALATDEGPEKIQPDNKTDTGKQGSTSRSQTVPTAGTGGPLMTIELKLDQPDIVLIEDFENINSNAVILNNEIQLRFRSNETNQVLSASLSKLELFTACYNPEHREETKSLILSPCDVSLHSSASKDSGHNVDINITPIILQVTPSTVQILNNIVMATQVPSQQTKEDKEIQITDFTDIWIPKRLKDCNFWFLNTLKPAEEADESLGLPLSETQDAIAPVTQENLVMEIEKIVLTVEVGVGNKTIPLILLDARFEARVKNWSSDMSIVSSFGMEIAYYNEKLAVWEPLIEPVETPHGHRPWEIRFQMAKNPDFPDVPDDATDMSPTDVVIQPPATTIIVESDDMLDITVTKTALEVLMSLSEAFAEAVAQAKGKTSEEPEAPYIVKNYLGLPVTVILTEGSFTVLGEKSSDIVEVVLEEGTLVPLVRKKQLRHTMSVLKQQDSKDEIVLILKIQNEQFDTVKRISVSRAEKRYFQLPHRTYPGDQWGLISNVATSCGKKIITFHSPVQVHNHLSVPVAVYYLKAGDKMLECCGIAEPNKVFSVPVMAIYTHSNELFFKPEQHDYGVCNEPFVWKDIRNEPSLNAVLQCNSKENKVEPFFIKAVGEMEHIYFEETNRKTLVSACYKIHLRPTVIFRNLVPHQVKYSLQGDEKEYDLEEGESRELWTMNIGKTQIELKIMDYMDHHWVCQKTPDASIEELTVWSFEAVTTTADVPLTLDLGVHAQWQDGSLVLVLYCPFWMINKTGLTLAYKRGKVTIEREDSVLSTSSAQRVKGELEREDSAVSTMSVTDDANVVIHPPDKADVPILFSFKAKHFFSKKKIAVKVNDSEWSDKFSIDVVGSSGTVLAKTKTEKSYMLGVEIRLSQSGLTKIIVYTPFYLIINSSQFDIEYRENVPNAPWILAPANECKAFWPNQTKMTEMQVRFAGMNQVSAPFSFAKQHITLLKLENSKGGIEVDCQITDSSTLLKFTEYSRGKATALIVNHTEKYTVSYCQKGKKEKQILGPQQSVYYTWEDPVGKRELIWTCAASKEQTQTLLQDGIGELKIGDQVLIYWVSFLDDMQRVLLVTEDLALATVAQQAGELERVETEIQVSLQGFGLCLTNNYTKAEIMYAAVVSSGIIWESCKNRQRRYKPLKVKECQAIEKVYQKYEAEVIAGKVPKSRQVIEGKFDVDFSGKPLPKLYKPFNGYLRRTFQPGLWVQLKMSPHNMGVHVKLNRMQIDNQLQDYVFPVVLAPVPPPKSVAADNAPKPFAELSIMQRFSEHGTVKQFKYFKLLVQEFHLKIDLGFLSSIIEFFAAEEPAVVDHAKQMKVDKEVVKQDLNVLAETYSSQEQKNFYDLLHFSPLKIHISFSMLGADTTKQNSGSIHLKFIGLLLRSVGVSVTEIQDVILRLNYFERNHMFLTQKLLISEVTSHYTSQTLKQLYVLVLGLDVIGNPVSLLLGLGEGVESFFYEPFQGAIQGPEEFVEGVALGVKSLFGHAVGGAAGAVSRITGTLGKGVAALTLDEEYQKKRRQNLNRQPQGLTHGLAQSGRGLVMGVVEGVTGVITKPVEGARQEGAKGFVTGVGKGLIGVVARPVSGVVDFASGSLDAVKRAVDVTEEVRRLRPPRHIKSDNIIRPYVRIEAEGHKLLQDVEKGKYASTDEYVAHTTIKNLEGRSFLMVTNKRIMFISKGDVFGQWDLDWQYTLEEIKGPPTVVDQGLKIMLKEAGKKRFGIFGSSEKGKIVNIGDRAVAEWLAKLIADLLQS